MVLVEVAIMNVILWGNLLCYNSNASKKCNICDYRTARFKGNKNEKGVK